MKVCPSLYFCKTIYGRFTAFDDPGVHAGPKNIAAGTNRNQLLKFGKNLPFIGTRVITVGRSFPVKNRTVKPAAVVDLAGILLVTVVVEGRVQSTIMKCDAIVQNPRC